MALYMAGFLEGVTNNNCSPMMHVAGTNDYYVQNPNNLGCYVASAEARAKLEKGMKFFVEQDYFYGVENLILWMRKAVDDLAACDADKVKDLATKVETQLNGIRATPDYFFTMRDNWNTLLET